MFENHNRRLMTVLLSVFFSALIAFSALAANLPWIAPSKENTTVVTTPTKKSSHSFIAPSEAEKQQQQMQQGAGNGNTSRDQNQPNNNLQLYKSYNSYQSYYEEQERLKKQQQGNKVLSPYYNQDKKNNVQQEGVSSVFVLSPDQANVLSNLDLRVGGDLPLTATTKKSILNVVEVIQNKTMLEQEKRKKVEEDIKKLETRASVLKLKSTYMDEVYSKAGLPKKYVAQKKEDNEGSLVLIEEALEKLRKY